MILKRKNQKGVAPIAVVIMMLTIALIGAALIEFVSSINESSNNMIDEIKALYLAEAGIAYAVKTLRMGIETEELEMTLGPIPLGDGNFTVKFHFGQSLIVTTGKVNDVSKTLNFQYNAF